MRVILVSIFIILLLFERASASPFDGVFIGAGGLKAKSENNVVLESSSRINSFYLGKELNKSFELMLRYLNLGTEIGGRYVSAIQNPLTGNSAKVDLKLPDIDFQSVELVTKLKYEKSRGFAFILFGLAEANTITYFNGLAEDVTKLSEVSYGASYGIGAGARLTNSFHADIEYSGFSPLTKSSPDYRNYLMLSLSYLFRDY